MKHIVKRKGHEEHFDERKVYASCYAACLGTRMKHTEAERVCENVCRDMKTWIVKKEEITSAQIFQQMVKTIKKYNKEAAFLYETHRDLT
ncbi:MAG: ATP cone domain-containing protein [bacterium]|nr:ATP cone domain-containing protein [bacterium]